MERRDGPHGYLEAASEGRRMVGRLNVDGDGQGISPDTEESTLNAYQNHTSAL